jgi:ribosomal protein S18 acetylase RimI-like enzyme
MRGPIDIEQRVEVHRSAFAPSRVTVASYSNVMAAWPYTTALDWVVEAPDGRFAASCLIWYDEANQCGELEPVGTHQDFRRMGLARAACLGALHALSDMGATSAVVSSVETSESSGATALYRGLGFVDVTTILKYGKRI